MTVVTQDSRKSLQWVLERSQMLWDWEPRKHVGRVQDGPLRCPAQLKRHLGGNRLPQTKRSGRAPASGAFHPVLGKGAPVPPSTWAVEADGPGVKSGGADTAVDLKPKP